MADVKKYLSYDKLGKYDAKIKGVIGAGDEATLAAAKLYADGLATNYDAAGSAASAQAAAEATAKAYTDTEVKKASDAAAAAQAKAEEGVTAAGVADGKAVAAQAAADKAQEEVDALELVVKNIQENAYDDTELRGLVTGLEASKADKTQVATDIASAKSELNTEIAKKADQTALDAVSAVANAAVAKTVYDAKVEALEAEDARIVGLVEAEATKAREEEGKLSGRLEEVEAFFHLAEGEQLDTALDRLVEIQTYLETEGAAADKMVEDIAANKKAIEDHAALDHDFAAADATLKSELEGKINLKAAQADLETLAGRVTVNEGAIAENAEAIADLEALFGEGDGTVADMIADAVAAEAELRVAGDEAAEASAAAALAAAQAADGKAVAAQGEVDALEGVVATLSGVVDTKAAQADLETLAGRVTTVEGKVTTLEGKMTAVEALAAANKAAHEANATAIAKKADQTALQAEIDRATAKEAAIEAKVDAFVEISEEEVNALFA